jgi:hypothetical protein
MLITVGQWELDVDVDATRRAYERISGGSHFVCECTTCRNFAALGESAYPEEFRVIARQLGIDLYNAAEIHEWGAAQEGLLDYGKLSSISTSS